MFENPIFTTTHTSEAPEQRAFLDAAKRGIHYLATIRARRVFPEQDALEALAGLSGDLPANPSDPMDVIALLDELGSPGTVALGGGRYFGFVCGGTLPAARAAGVLACAWDQNAAMRILSPTAAELEATALRWIIGGSNPSTNRSAMSRIKLRVAASGNAAATSAHVPTNIPFMPRRGKFSRTSRTSSSRI
jgi:hypothetical protein